MYLEEGTGKYLQFLLLCILHIHTMAMSAPGVGPSAGAGAAASAEGWVEANSSHSCLEDFVSF